MLKNLHILLLAQTIVLFICSCGKGTEHGGPVPSQTGGAGFVSATESQFLDPTGRPLLLHGINVVNKSKEQAYTGGLGPADFASIRSWGMNCVRFGILWDGLEPEPGKIDEAYLDRIAQCIKWARAQGLYILLDMHQDLYSVKFSDGAPVWATLDEGKPHTTGAVWSDAYYASQAVQSALDHFWANSLAPDHLGLQEHYARVWQQVARRFAGEPAVVGYDLMNEPSPGADGGRCQQAMLRRMAELMAARPGQKAPSVEMLAKMQGSPDGRKQLTQWLGDLELYTKMLEAAAPIMQDFERARLMPMYARVAQAIRQVDARHILFLEPAMDTNMGIVSAMEPLKDSQGGRYRQQAYAPHGYDIVTDTDSLQLTSNARVELIFRRHAEKSRALRMPMLVGEWGAFYLDQKAVEPARFVISQFDLYGCSDTYWSYEPKLGQSPLLDALRRSMSK